MKLWVNLTVSSNIMRSTRGKKGESVMRRTSERFLLPFVGNIWQLESDVVMAADCWSLLQCDGRTTHARSAELNWTCVCVRGRGAVLYSAFLLC